VTIRLDIGHYLPIGDPLEQSLYIQLFSRYWPLRALGSLKTLTFQGHVTSSVTWPFDSQVAISNRQSIFTKSLSPAISEIMGTKHIGVMTLTLQGHVTSSVTWPFHSWWSISYWWSFGPKSLSLTVSEIFRPKHHVLIDTMLNRHCACALSRDMYPGCKI